MQINFSFQTTRELQKVSTCRSIRLHGIFRATKSVDMSVYSVAWHFRRIFYSSLSTCPDTTPCVMILLTIRPRNGGVSVVGDIPLPASFCTQNGQFTTATPFCTAVPNVGGSITWSWLHVSLLAPIALRCLLELWTNL